MSHAAFPFLSGGKGLACLFLLTLAGSCCPPVKADPTMLRVPRTQAIKKAIFIDMSQPLVAPGAQREPIAAAATVPGIYRSFLVWKQRYAHLALCNMTLCNGSCLYFGDGCLVCAQEPILPLLLGTYRDGCTDPFVTSAAPAPPERCCP
jgi:hypothetical protein